MITNKIKTLRSTPEIKNKVKSSTERFIPPFMGKNLSISTCIEQQNMMSQSKVEPAYEKKPQKSLSRIQSDSKLLNNNSYIKIKNVEPNCIESFLQTMSKYQTERSRLVSMKSAEFLDSMSSTNLNSSSKRLKFARKSPAFNEEGKKKKSATIQQGLQQKELKMKEKQIETLKQQLELTMKSLQSKNKKIRQYEKICTNLKKQCQEKISKADKKCSELASALLNKEKEIDELQFQIKKFTLDNQNLQKKIQQIMNEPSFCKEAEGSVNMTSTGDNLCILNELEDELYQKNLQIYQLKKNLDKFQIKGHYLKAQHQDQMNIVRKQSKKKQIIYQKRYRDLLTKYQALENQNKLYRVVKSSGKRNNPQRFECKEQQSLDLSLSFDF